MALLLFALKSMDGRKRERFLCDVVWVQGHNRAAGKNLVIHNIEVSPISIPIRKIYSLKIQSHQIHSLRTKKNSCIHFIFVIPNINIVFEFISASNCVLHFQLTKSMKKKHIPACNIFDFGMKKNVFECTQ